MTSPLRHLKPAIILDCFEDFGDFHLIVCSEILDALTLEPKKPKDRHSFKDRDFGGIWNAILTIGISDTILTLIRSSIITLRRYLMAYLQMQNRQRFALFVRITLQIRSGHESRHHKQPSLPASVSGCYVGRETLHSFNRNFQLSTGQKPVMDLIISKTL